MNLLSDYDYDLPDELIARQPSPQRDGSRLLVVDRVSGTIEHTMISELPRFLQPGDCLVLNDTKVLPARLLGKRTVTGGAWEGLYLGCDEEGRWQILSKTRGKLQPGEQITLLPPHDDDAKGYQLTLRERDDEGGWFAQPESAASTIEILQQFGTVPLPPYIGRELATDQDWQRYQTTYARRFGAVAAPTAGLHFTPELLTRCTEKGVAREFVTLHVGIGTFRPISAENLAEHRMHAEWCELTNETATQLQQTRNEGGRILAVGTTSVRTLESASQSGAIAPYCDRTEIFIRPPYDFQATDGLLTNFHLPKSSLLVMISALAGRELIFEAYRQAIEQRYRFFSYGDAMLIV